MTSDNVTDCFTWDPDQMRPELYNSRSFFYYVSKIVVAINSLSAPVSVIGNGLVLVAILRTRSLHTTANILIGSLVVADLMVGAVVQTLMTAAMMTETFYWNCPFVDCFSYLGISIGSISAMSMTAVSCERYIALFFSMRYTEIVTNKRAYIVVFSIWITSFALCSLSFFARSFLFHILRTVGGSLLSTFCISTICFSYFKIFGLVRHHRRQIQAQVSAVVSDSTRNHIKQTKLAITTSYVIGTSLVCYSPAICVLLIFVNTPMPNTALFNSFYLLMSIQLMSSCVNPVIYCWRRREIRQPTLALLCSFKEKLFCHL